MISDLILFWTIAIPRHRVSTTGKIRKDYIAKNCLYAGSFRLPQSFLQVRNGAAWPYGMDPSSILDWHDAMKILRVQPHTLYGLYLCLLQDTVDVLQCPYRSQGSHLKRIFVSKTIIGCLFYSVFDVFQWADLHLQYLILNDTRQSYQKPILYTLRCMSC